MTLRTALLAALALFSIQGAIWLYHHEVPVAVVLPVRTQADQVAVDRAMREGIGNYTIVDSEQGIYFKIGKGKRWIIKRELYI
jgi:hypothetical protein